MELKKYLEAIKNAANDAYRKIEATWMDTDIADEKLRNDYRLSKEATEEERIKIESKFKADMQAARDAFNAVLNQQEAGYMKEVFDFYSPDGSKIDLNDMNLIKSGLLLSLENIHEKIMQYSDNVTMLLIFSKYIQENKIELEGDLGTEIAWILRRVNIKGDAERRAFKGYVDLVTAGMTHQDRSYIYVWQKLDQYEIETEIKILKASPVIDEAVQNQISTLEGKLSELEQKSGFFQKKPINTSVYSPEQKIPTDLLNNIYH